MLHISLVLIVSYQVRCGGQRECCGCSLRKRHQGQSDPPDIIIIIHVAIIGIMFTCIYVQYGKLHWVRVTYVALCLDARPPIQEKGDGSILTITSSPMEGSNSILQEGHADRHT